MQTNKVPAKNTFPTGSSSKQAEIKPTKNSNNNYVSEAARDAIKSENDDIQKQFGEPNNDSDEVFVYEDDLYRFTSELPVTTFGSFEVSDTKLTIWLQRIFFQDDNAF